MLFAPKPVHEGKGPIEDILLVVKDALVAEAELVSLGELSVELPGWQHMLVYALIAMLGAAIWSLSVGRRRAATPWVGERWLRLVVVLGFIGLGLVHALDRAACFDDAYITLRYAENFVAGKGIVFNEGEYVEGYTNFLWLLIVSLFMVITPFEAPLIAVVAALVAFGLNLFVVWRISLEIAPPFHKRAFAFPLALALLAAQHTFTDYGTTGLETGFASLMVNLGVLALISGDDAKSTFWAGFCWIMATLTRPDHALFYAVGSAVVFGVWVVPLWHARKSGLRTAWREGLMPMTTYAAPFLIWAIYAAWKLRYYGELLPNTYYAKSAYMTYWDQGYRYFTAHHVGDHLWIVILALVLLWPWRRPSNVPARRFMAFMIPAVVAYELYVIRVGGDFMYGRFYVSLVPLYFLAGEQLVHEFSASRAVHKARIQALVAARRARWAAIKAGPSAAAAQAQGLPETEPEATPPNTATRMPLAIGAIVITGLLAASAVDIRPFYRLKVWHITDENSYYRISSWAPIGIAHPMYRTGVVLGEIHAGLEARGLDSPVLASGAIGMIGYYSHMEVIDRLGLTDATVAHQEIKKRGRPGHEKWATGGYLRERKVNFRRGGGYPKWFSKYGSIKFAEVGGRRWFILLHDPEMLAAIHEIDPYIEYYPFGLYIDQYIADLPNKKRKQVRKEWVHLRRYYFDHNEDPERREAFDKYFKWSKKHDAKELLDNGSWDVYVERGKQAKELERELRAEQRERRNRVRALVPRWPPKPRAKPKVKPRPKPKAKPSSKPRSEPRKRPAVELQPIPEPPSPQ